MAELAKDKLARAKQKIIVALDVPTESEALELVDMLKDSVNCFKVGLEFLTSAGIDIARRVKDRGGRVFYDGKFHDIPNTVAGACRAAVRLNVDMFTIHAIGGAEMMQRAKEATHEEARRLGVEPPMILGVTMLTSIDQHTMESDLRVPGNIGVHVVHLGKLAQRAGLDGVVASPLEIEVLTEHVPGLKIITPGIRPEWAAAQDQKRTTTPAEAISKGAYALVIGRAITKPPRGIGGPTGAAARMLEEIAAALPDERTPC
ncbi:orotidine-5'-phosphate decarboxylase [Chloroflexota bacterium]